MQEAMLKEAQAATVAQEQLTIYCNMIDRMATINNKLGKLLHRTIGDNPNIDRPEDTTPLELPTLDGFSVANELSTFEISRLEDQLARLEQLM
jgi:hypothetical protein